MLDIYLVKLFRLIAYCADKYTLFRHRGGLVGTFKYIVSEFVGPIGSFDCCWILWHYLQFFSIFFPLIGFLMFYVFWSKLEKGLRYPHWYRKIRFAFVKVHGKYGKGKGIKKGKRINLDNEVRAVFKFVYMFFSIFFVTFIYFVSFIFILLGRQDSFFVFYPFNGKVLNLFGSSIDFCISIELSYLTVLLVWVIGTVICMVKLYSLEYMKEDPNFGEFMAYLSLFTFFMLFLIVSSNIVQFLFCWEGVGLVSFLLIGFWSFRVVAIKSALKAILVNKIGDMFLILGFIVFFYYTGTLEFFYCEYVCWKFNEVLLILNNFELKVVDLICLCFVVAAGAKSAQFGLHVWLPDAMEGPTPVSALIHAATMVTAGVILLVKFSFLLEFSYISQLFLVVLGSLTSLFGSLVAIVQYDIKKIVAFSTCSQLGYMILACGLLKFDLAVFHLLNHSFFKALLFLSSGVVIHSLNGEQDIRRMGGLVRLLPFTYFVMFFGLLSLCGFPFLTGYYSKDMILVTIMGLGNIELFFVWIACILILSVVGTVIYSVRLLYLVFLSRPRAYRNLYNSCHEFKGYIFFSQFVLFLGSVFFGFVAFDFIVGLARFNWFFTFWKFNSSINYGDFVFISSLKFFDFLVDDWIVRVFPILLSFFVGLIILIFFYFFGFIDYLFFRFLWILVRLREVFVKLEFLDFVVYYLIYFVFFLFWFLSKRFYVDVLYNYFVLGLMRFGFFLYKLIDRGILEWLGPRGLTSFVLFLSNIVRVVSFVFCFVKDYLFFFVVMIFIFLCLVLYFV